MFPESTYLLKMKYFFSVSGRLPFDDDDTEERSSQSPPPLEGEEENAMETDAPSPVSSSTPRVHQNEGDAEQGLRYRMR